MSAVHRIGRSCVALVLPLLVGGCLLRSPSTQFLTLDTVDDTRVLQDVGSAPVAMGDVELPPELDREQLVRRTGESGVSVASTVRWSAPLEQLVRRTLVLDLAARLPEGRVVLPGQPDPEKPMRVFIVTFEKLFPGPGPAVTLDAHWTLVDSRTNEQLQTGASSLTVHARSADPTDIAVAMSDALGRLADSMAEALRRGS